MKPKNPAPPRKVADLNIIEWQELLSEFNATTPIPSTPATPAAMRIENTMFTTARYAGGCTIGGKRHTYFEPAVPGEKPNPDGSPHVAWLLVRDDFLKWAAKELKSERRK